MHKSINNRPFPRVISGNAQRELLPKGNARLGNSFRRLRTKPSDEKPT
jgi:hypothetical protein